MKTSNNPLPFYTLEGDIWTNYKPLWHHNNQHCLNTCCYSHVFYTGIHWFQHKVSATTSNIESVKLRKVSDNSEVAATIDANLYSFGSDRFVVISLDIDSGLIGSNYYLAIETAQEKFYSEVFCVNDQLNDRVAVVWSSDCRVGDIVYNSSIKNLVNLDAIVVPSPPEIETEVVENGEGDETPTFQKLKQKYTFSCVVPNFLARALSALSLHNKYNIIDRFGGETYSGAFDTDIKEVAVENTPEEDGCNTFVQITYVKETVVKTGCCDGELSLLVTKFTIWNENLGQEDEFDVPGYLSTIELDNADAPYDGAVCIMIPDMSGTIAYIVMIHDTGFSYIEDGEMQIYVKTTADWTPGSSFLKIVLAGNSGHSALNTFDTVTLASMGFDHTMHDTWQLLTIPMSEFDFAGSTVNSIEFDFYDTPQIRLDKIEYFGYPSS